ncbi:polymorphic toxin type 30 domain-containing protein [Myxococcus sp. RHSTA-1-4]|uniref:polymorphic toxin type 30 domain-containing protein n=1 Tax=Myxococcus sp. RHSTA-1-4 TaxID=2874601 RepID=UPI001CBCCAF4|nr:polymorphic toxin type 30 domain-containing protein [Myxococcus sp. RHSTA-1-4]MBZ4420137.1 hypothetical protein [Myxococcus sp. RHSTA-1-4]
MPLPTMRAAQSTGASGTYFKARGGLSSERRTSHPSRRESPARAHGTGSAPRTRGGTAAVAQPFIGLADLFGGNDWVPTGGVPATAANFENLRHAPNGTIWWSELRQLIPAGTPNTYEFGPRAPRGFKFEWVEPGPTRYHVHGHEPDAGAPIGGAGGAGWVVRIRRNNVWLLAAPWAPAHPAGMAPTDWSAAGGAAALAHIPFDPNQ